MKKVLITIAAVLTLMSCSKEEQVQTETTQNENSFSIADDYSLVSLDRFVNGAYQSTEQFSCLDTWTFTTGLDFIKNEYRDNEGVCEFAYQTQNTYTATEDIVTIGNTVHQLTQYSGGMSLSKTLSDDSRLIFNFEIK